jgi:hypothetical protein
VIICLGIGTFISFGQVLQSSNKIHCRIRILAFLAKELQYFVLFYSQIEICDAIAGGLSLVLNHGGVIAIIVIVC